MKRFSSDSDRVSGRAGGALQSQGGKDECELNVMHGSRVQLFRARLTRL